MDGVQLFTGRTLFVSLIVGFQFPLPEVVEKTINGDSNEEVVVARMLFLVFIPFASFPSTFSIPFPQIPHITSPPAAERIHENYVLRDLGERADKICSVLSIQRQLN